MTKKVQKVSKFLQKNNLKVVTAESCTGGWVAKILTDLPGSSAYFERGFVTYSNQAKQDMLGVSKETLDKYGAVSEPVVAEMTSGALKNSISDVAIAISGIAGPGGGTKEKPVGTVCFSWQLKNHKAETQTMLFKGDRDSIREQSVEFIINGIIDKMGAAIDV